MARTIVGVLRGGTSNEYNLSLKTGAAMMAALPEEAYEIRDIFIDRSGAWHLRGIPVEPARALSQIDVALNAMHGGVGEDGTIQRMLDRAGIPYPGARAPAAGLSLNKVRARAALQSAGVRMPRGISFSLDNELNTGEMALAVFSQFGPPYIVKPGGGGASYGVRYAPDLVSLPDAIGDVLDAFGVALIEEYVFGEDASAGIIEDFRGQKFYALPPAHIEHDGERFLETRSHEEGLARATCPSNFTHGEKKAIENLARTAHRALGLCHFSRSDIRVTKHGPYLLEVNAVPGLYPGSSFPQMLEAVGSSVGKFLEHTIALARR